MTGSLAALCLAACGQTAGDQRVRARDRIDRQTMDGERRTHPIGERRYATHSGRQTPRLTSARRLQLVIRGILGIVPKGRQHRVRALGERDQIHRREFVAEIDLSRLAAARTERAGGHSPRHPPKSQRAKASTTVVRLAPATPAGRGP